MAVLQKGHDDHDRFIRVVNQRELFRSSRNHKGLRVVETLAHPFASLQDDGLAFDQAHHLARPIRGQSDPAGETDTGDIVEMIGMRGPVSYTHLTLPTNR